MRSILLAAMLLLTGCGLGFTRESTTRGGWQHAPAPIATPPGGPWGVPGVKVVTINQNGMVCTLVFQDGLYVGGTC